ncbi:MAG: hypothetical protein DIZ80_13060 [endosymbiont of Galathealinum brachiosum]|uniref:Uncharacterized protein n=1 Tax=endosymbiont of Galathealinum brachiosum TaxID=2200906 RepID=A0A370DA43_9GAMM|nr:MAG: hypothetical protein DIZ80_13060 [endosymbiont of Galathealinum brachiosum]
MHSQLHKLIGQQITHDNKSCMLIEVIDNGPLLVFQCLAKKEIQHDQHGNANRRSLPTFTIHCLNEFKTDLHPVLKELLSTTEQKTLLNKLV